MQIVLLTKDSAHVPLQIEAVEQAFRNTAAAGDVNEQPCTNKRQANGTPRVGAMRIVFRVVVKV